MLRRLGSTVLLLSLLVPTVAALARADAGIVPRGKAATALVVMPMGRGFGSAFCVDAAGLFVTNEHVVRGLPAGAACSLVLNSGEEDERVVRATVVRTDAKTDLALLRAEGTKGLTVLELGDVTGLVETAQVTAFGYPFGDLLAVKEKKYPSISVNVGRVTALRKEMKRLSAIQIDAVLNPGNSGGPVLDATGKVIGVVRAGYRGAGVNFAIPATLVAAFLDKPEIVFVPTPVSYARRHQPAKFTIRVVSFGKARPKSTVELVLTAGADERKLSATPGKDGSYTVTTPPVPPHAGPLSVPLNLVFPSGRIQCEVKDQTFAVGKKKFRLSEVRTISQGARPGVVTRAGAEVSGALTGLGTTQAELGGYAIEVDLGKAPRIVVEYAEPVILQVDYKVTVRQDGKVVNRLAGALKLDGAPVAATIKEPYIEPPKMAAEKSLVRLPAGIEHVAVGGGGRYLILHLKRLNKLAIFDASQGKVARYLPVPAEHFVFAASADKLLVAIPGKKLLERWDLETFEKEQSAPLPVDFAPVRIALGSASAGPLLLWAPPRLTALIDIATLKQLPISIEIAGNLAPHGLEVEAAPDGSAFTTWFRRQHTEEPSRFGLIRLNGTALSRGYGLSLRAPCHASIDGGPVFTGDGNVYTGDLKPIAAPALRGASLLPIRNSYVLVTRWEGKERKCRLAVHLMGSLKEVFALDLDELDGQVTDRTDPTPFSYDRRIHFLPTAGLLLTIPTTNDSIVIRKIDVDAALKKSGLDFLFVASVPVRQAVKGAAYSYPVEVKSKRGSVEYRLDSGPEGMSVSPAGRLTWKVPADFAGGEVPVILSIRDASGQEVFHSFSVRCR